MKNIARIIILFILVPVLLFTNCKKSEEEQNQFLTLKSYLEAEGLDLDKIITNADGKAFVIGAKTADDLNGKYIVDIRSAADFTKGHIAGAKNIAFGSLLDEAVTAETNGQDMVIVCYTGQTACYGVSLLRLAGYSNTQALKWGMSGWNAQFDVWSTKIDNIAKDHANWSYETAPALSAYGNPLVITDEESGADILMARIKTVLAEGAKTVSAADVLNAPENYFINNYFNENDYSAFGHIKGAYRILPLTLANGAVSNLDPAAKICTYCYTGQTSAVVTAYLRVLGFDAHSVLFGMNNLYNSNEAWSANQWGGDSKSKDFPVQ